MNTQRQFGWGFSVLLSLALWAGILASVALAQTPNPVTPGYQVCNTGDPGNTHCSFQPVDATHGLPTTLGGSGAPAGSTSNATSAVAPTATNIPAVSFNYVWNGSSWDQAVAPVSNTSNSGTVSVQNASPSGVATPGSAVAISTVGKATFVVQTTSNTLNQPLTIQCTGNGTDWVSLTSSTSIASLSTNSFYNLTTNIPATTNNVFFATVNGCTQMRVSENAVPTGSAVVWVGTSDQTSVIEGNSTFLINGQSGSGSTVAGNPVRTGPLGQSANPAAVTTGTAVNGLGTLLGAQVTRPFSIPEAEWFTGAAPVVITASNQQVAAAPAAGIRNYMTWVDISCSATWIANTLQFQSVTTVVYELDLPAGAGVYHQQFLTPLKTAAAAAFNVKATGAVTGSCKINAAGYAAP